MKFWRKRFRETGDVLEEVQSGRPKKNSTKTDKLIVKFQEHHPEATSAAIANNLKHKKIKISDRS